MPNASTPWWETAVVEKHSNIPRLSVCLNEGTTSKQIFCKTKKGCQTAASLWLQKHLQKVAQYKGWGSRWQLKPLASGTKRLCEGLYKKSALSVKMCNNKWQFECFHPHTSLATTKIENLFGTLFLITVPSPNCNNMNILMTIAGCQRDTGKWPLWLSGKWLVQLIGQDSWNKLKLEMMDR